MSEGACNYRFSGPAMKPHWNRVKWNAKHILDFKNLNPHTKELKKIKIGLTTYERYPKAHEDLWASMVDIPVRYARLCPTKAGRVQFALGIILSISLVVNAVLAGVHWL